MAWSASTVPVERGRQDGKVLSFLASNVAIVKGDIVRIAADGYLTNAAPASGDMSAGLALESVDNSGGSAGALGCLVQTEGVVAVYKDTLNAAISDVGNAALCDEAVDCQSITLGAFSSGNCLLGGVVGLVRDPVTGIVDVEKVWVKLKTLQQIKT